MDKISLKAPAKINLYLDVLKKRDDGYHEIESLMQAIDICDEITLEKSDRISLLCDDPKLPSDENNIAFKAAIRMKEHYNFPGISINLKKSIPYGAGLGGGSSDAASVIRGFCALYSLNPRRDELIELAASIGSDVPFFLTGGQAIATGRGEKLRAISLPLNYQILVISPRKVLSTAEVYKKIRISLTQRNHSILLLSNIDESTFIRALGSFKNDLEDVAVEMAPELGMIKKTLSMSGADFHSMSGSGSSFYALYFNPNKIVDELEGLKSLGHRVYFTRPITLPPLI